MAAIVVQPTGLEFPRGKLLAANEMIAHTSLSSRPLIYAYPTRTRTPGTLAVNRLSPIMAFKAFLAPSEGEYGNWEKKGTVSRRLRSVTEATKRISPDLHSSLESKRSVAASTYENAS
jgi:hypothetical protein